MLLCGISHNFQISFTAGWKKCIVLFLLIKIDVLLAYTIRKLQNFVVIVKKISFNFSAFSNKGLSGKQLDFGFLQFIKKSQIFFVEKGLAFFLSQQFFPPAVLYKFPWDFSLHEIPASCGNQQELCSNIQKTPTNRKF